MKCICGGGAQEVTTCLSAISVASVCSVSASVTFC